MTEFPRLKHVLLLSKEWIFPHLFGCDHFVKEFYILFIKGLTECKIFFDCFFRNIVIFDVMCYNVFTQEKGMV